MLGVSLLGWPVTPRSPQPRSSILMMTKLGCVEVRLSPAQQEAEERSSNSSSVGMGIATLLLLQLFTSYRFKGR